MYSQYAISREGIMSASVHYDPRFERSDSEKLGDEITELCGYIYAATHHLLELIREFDDMRYWEYAVALMFPR